MPLQTETALQSSSDPVQRPSRLINKQINFDLQALAYCCEDVKRGLAAQLPV